MRRRVMARCAELRIPVINAAPLGMGTAFLVFEPGGMTFEQWFRLEGLSEENQYINFLLGMAPSALHRGYLVDPSRVDLRRHRGPSTVAGCELSAAVASVEAVKILLGRGRVRAVPYYHQFDAYSGRWVVRKLPGGNGHPLQRLKIALSRRFLSRLSNHSAEPEAGRAPQSEIERILDAARWAPSGDNIQPWRFEIIDDDHLVVHLTAECDVYNYRDGEPTLLSGGALLESLRIAATAQGRGFEWSYQGREDHTHRIAVFFPNESEVRVDPLLSYLPMRSVDRGPYRLRRLREEQKAALVAALQPELGVEWHEGLRMSWRMARRGARATGIRLTDPQAFKIHQQIIDWDRQYSPTGIPAAAIGVSRLTRGLMRWAMRSWPRVQFLNRLGATMIAALEMDYVPGLLSAGFFTLSSRSQATADVDRVAALLRAGQAIQRFWLTASQLGLVMQPNLAPLCFGTPGGTGPERYDDADQRPIFQGRIGSPFPQRITARSTRRQLNELVTRPKEKAPERGPLIHHHL
jgi:hypothetical protein